MQYFSIIALCLTGLVHSLDMRGYTEGPNVHPDFRSWLEAIYHSTEDPAATTQFSNFFTSDGKLIVRGITATGADEIIKMKLRLLPTNGNKHWNHRPGATVLHSENDKEIVYQADGINESTYVGGNCSQAHYSTYFAIRKDAKGAVSYAPRAFNLARYDDFRIDPAVTPTDIPCGGP